MGLLLYSTGLERSRESMGDNAPIIENVKISCRDENEKQLMVDSILPINELPLPPGEKKKRRELWGKTNSTDTEKIEYVELILQMFMGEDRFVMYFEDTKKKREASCLIHEAFLKGLRIKFGYDNVKEVN